MSVKSDSHLSTTGKDVDCIALIGDVALNGLFCSDKDGNTNRLLAISKQLEDCGLVFANLETPVIGKTDEFNKEKVHGKGILNYTKRDVLTHSLSLLNVSAVSLANNHIYDCGIEGVKETIDCLDENGVLHTGAGLKREHIDPVFMEVDGVRIGFISYVDSSTNPCIPDNSGIFVNYLDEEKVCKDIIEAKKECDKLLLSLHWGPDYSHYPYKHQRIAVKEFVKAGADVIIGHHSHTVQPYEEFFNRSVFYSLGSLCYGDFIENGQLRALRRKTKRGLIPILNKEMKTIRLIHTRELEGNKIVIARNGKNKFRLVVMKLVHQSNFAYHMLLFKEAFIDRMVDYFFGYYRNPFKQLVSVSNWKKIHFIKQDLSRGKNTK